MAMKLKLEMIDLLAQRRPMHCPNNSLQIKSLEVLKTLRPGMQAQTKVNKAHNWTDVLRPWFKHKTLPLSESH